MKTFFDSSAFAKRYVEALGSDAVESLCQSAIELGLCVICVPEILSALNRRVRGRQLKRGEYDRLKQQLVQDASDASIIDLAASVVAAAITLLESSPIRAADAMHVAAAMIWEADLFVSADRQQLAAARRAGLATKAV